MDEQPITVAQWIDSGASGVVQTRRNRGNKRIVTITMERRAMRDDDLAPHLRETVEELVGERVLRHGYEYATGGDSWVWCDAGGVFMDHCPVCQRHLLATMFDV